MTNECKRTKRYLTSCNTNTRRESKVKTSVGVNEWFRVGITQNRYLLLLAVITKINLPGGTITFHCIFENSK